MPAKIPRFGKGFTLIEVLTVIAIIGVLSSIAIIAINPTKRLQQARDSKRKAEITQLSKALDAYFLKFNFPAENWCDSSIGVHGQPCNVIPPGSIKNDWEKTGPSNYIYKALVLDNKYMNNLPVDPINNVQFHYELEVYQNNNKSNTPCSSAQGGCEYYWIGTRLEAPADSNKSIFRCSNVTDLPNGSGCKEIAQGNSPGLGNDDPDCTESDGDCW